MSEKTTVSETKYEINDMLNRYGLSDSFKKCIIKYGEKMRLVQGAKAEEFIISKLDDLVKTIDDNKTNKTTDDELKTLISGWITEQDLIVDQMVKKITKKAFDQNDVKTMNVAKNIDFTSLLKTFELEDEFYGTVVKICNKLGYHQDKEGKEYIFSTFTNCNEYLTDHSTKIPTPEPEFRDLVVGWIAKQNETLESLEEYERKEDLSFIQQVMNKYVGNGHEYEIGCIEDANAILIHEGQDKPITITRDTKTADHSILEALNLWDMLYAVELENPLFDVFLKQGTKLNLKNDAAGEEFVFSKHEELKAYFNASKKDVITIEDVKALMSGWIEEQARIADQMHQVEGSETQTLDQNDVKKMGLAYQILQAEKEIETLSEENLKTRIAQGYPVEAEDLNNQAEQFTTQGKYDEAEPLYKRALEIVEKSLGPDHTEVAESLNNLAVVYKEQGRYKEAEPLFKRGLEILEKSLGPDHYKVEIYLDDMAEFYKVQGRYEEAEPIYLRTIAINAKNLGPDNISIVTNLDALALLYKTQGRYTEAEPLYIRALAINEKLDPDHPDVSISLNYLAVLYREQGRYTEAEPLLRRALTIMETSRGPNHPDTRIARKNLKILQEESAKKAKSDEKPKNINIATDIENKDVRKNPPQPVSGASGVNQ